MDAGSRDREWQERCESHTIVPLMQFGDAGLVLGAGTVLAPAVGSARDVSVEVSEPRLLALLTAAHLRSASPLGLAHIRKAAVRWSEGDVVFASMHLALSGLDRLARPVADARRLFLADRFLNEGLEAKFVVEALGSGSTDGVSKYSPDQPRVPSGSGRTSGQWTSGATTPSVPAAASLSNPILRPVTNRPGEPGRDQATASQGLDARTFRVELPFAIIGAAAGPLTPFGEAVKRVADSVEIGDSISKWRELGPKGEAAIEAAVLARGWQLLGIQVPVRTALGLRVEDIMVHVPPGTAGNAEGYDGFIEVKVNGGRYNALQRAKDALIRTAGGTLIVRAGDYQAGSKIFLDTGLANVTIRYEPE